VETLLDEPPASQSHSAPATLQVAQGNVPVLGNFFRRANRTRPLPARRQTPWSGSAFPRLTAVL
jgi:hypothetical protein